MFSYFLSFFTFQSYCFSKIVTHRLKSTMETLRLTYLGKFLDLQAVLSVTECIGHIVFKRVENTSSNGP